jgi:hypothetical protein
MTGTMQNSVLIALIVVIGLFVLYQYDSTLFGLLGHREGFEEQMKKATEVKSAMPADASKPATEMKSTEGDNTTATAPANGMNGTKDVKGTQMKPTATKKEAFADLASFEGPANFSSVDPPAGCYPRDQLTPSELLPLDQSSIYAQQNPMGPGSLKGKNFLSAGALIGVNTVGQSLRNANLQLRSEPPNPQVPVSIFLNSTISPDISHRPLEIGA